MWNLFCVTALTVGISLLLFFACIITAGDGTDFD